jgi:pimeloyl-ACP methyl ester carboxylesterase
MKTLISNQLRFLTPKPRQLPNPLFVFLPGMDGTGKLLYKQADSLAPYFDLRCLAIPTDDLSDWDTLATQVIGLIEQELAKKPLSSVYLCGESFGGCLALKVILAAPKLCSRLILINPASSFRERPWLSWGVPLTGMIPEFVHQQVTPGLLPFLGALNRMQEGDRRALLEAMQSISSDVVSWRLSLLRDFQLDLAKLRYFQQPVLLIASAADLLLPSVTEAERLRSIFPQANTIYLPQSGHACLLEQEVQLAQFLEQVNWC